MNCDTSTRVLRTRVLKVHIATRACAQADPVLFVDFAVNGNIPRHRALANDVGHNMHLQPSNITAGLNLCSHVPIVIPTGISHISLVEGKTLRVVVRTRSNARIRIGFVNDALYHIFSSSRKGTIFCGKCRYPAISAHAETVANAFIIVIFIPIPPFAKERPLTFI